MLLRTAVLTATFAILAACATSPGPTRANHLAEQWQATFNRVYAERNDCLTAAAQQADPSSLTEILVLSGPDDPDRFDKVQIERQLQSHEKDALIGFFDATRACRLAEIEGLSEVHPAFVEARAHDFAATDRVVIDLLRDAITIGDANAAFLDQMARAEIAWDRATQAADADLARLHEGELAERASRRRAAAAALGQWSQQMQSMGQHQQLMNQMNRPRNTTCQYIGQQLSCTSY